MVDDLINLRFGLPVVSELVQLNILIRHIFGEAVRAGTDGLAAQRGKAAVIILLIISARQNIQKTGYTMQVTGGEVIKAKRDLIRIIVRLIINNRQRIFRRSRMEDDTFDGIRFAIHKCLCADDIAVIALTRTIIGRIKKHTQRERNVFRRQFAITFMNLDALTKHKFHRASFLINGVGFRHCFNKIHRLRIIFKQAVEDQTDDIAVISGAIQKRVKDAGRGNLCIVEHITVIGSGIVYQLSREFAITSGRFRTIRRDGGSIRI